MAKPLLGVAVIALAGLLAIGSAALAARGRPALRIVQPAPLMITGTQFRAKERIRLVVRDGGARWTRNVRAGEAGRFHLRFRRALDLCAVPVTVTARGKRSGLVRAPIPTRECPAP